MIANKNNGIILEVINIKITLYLFELNKYLISLIDKIDGHSQLVQRAIRQEEYLLINQYANVSVNFLVDIFNKFLEQFKIEYD